MARPMNFISLNDHVIVKLKEKYGHHEKIIHPFTYPNQEQGFIAVEFPGYLIFTRDDLSNEVIREITRVMAENITQIAACGDGLEARPGTGLASNWGVPRHPGAVEYFRSMDWIP